MRFLSIVCFGLLASTAPLLAASPNIVVIMTDDQDDVGSMAYLPKTHTLLAEQGITFTHSFVNVPLCGPSRASFFTGQTARNHGVRSNSPKDGGGWEGFRGKEANSLPVWLQAAGYRTALIGKYMNRYGQQNTLGYWLTSMGRYLNVQFDPSYVGSPRDWVPPGWDFWYAFTVSRVRYYDYAINDNGSILSFGSREEDYSTDVLKERAARFILDQAGKPQPFFLYIATKAAHAQGIRPLPAPKYAHSLKEVRLPKGPAFNEADVRGKAIKAPRLRDVETQELELTYRAALRSLQSVDDLVAAVVEALQGAGELDDTVIIYTSDNGFLFGEHRLVGKSTAYEESIKVPLIVKGPGIPKNETRSELVNNLDVVATIVDLAGAKPGVPLDGRSLRPLFAGKDAAWRSAVLLEGPANRFETPKHLYNGVRTATRKYVRYDDGFEELFDLAADPHELNNVSPVPSYAGDLGALRDLQTRLKSCSGESCFVP